MPRRPPAPESTLLEPLRTSGDSPLDVACAPVHPPIVGPNGAYYGHEWSRWRYDTLDRRVDEALALSGRGGQEILDIGCASGARAADFARQGHRVTGIDVIDRFRDIETRNHELGRSAHGAGERPAIAFIHADIRDLPPAILGMTFDLIHARRVLNFITIDEVAGFFGLVALCLAPKGILAVSFIASEIGAPGEMTTPRPRGTKPVLRLCPGMEAHHFSAVHHSLREQGLCILEAFSDRQVEGGFIAGLSGP